MPKVEYEKTGRIARITLNRPEVRNAIDEELAELIEVAVRRACADRNVRVLILSGNGKSFCAGYDLKRFAEEGVGFQDMPWDAMRDFEMMSRFTEHFMSLWKSSKPVICKVHGHAVAGGSDIALCADLVVMADSARIGYMPARIWGCPTTAMWVYRVGPEQAKRMLFTGDVIDGKEAERIGLVLKSVPEEDLGPEVEALAERIASIPSNHLAMHKMVVNRAIEAMGLGGAQNLSILLDGIARHSPEGVNFKKRAEEVGWKRAVEERDQGSFDWTDNRPFDIC
ncbi:MAG: crotonase/enoyl-CoA hydratase family protein [Albidovulum sp.]|nr:crotonase/enoyl-CoA hydratase family protein [Albidovulum sp.]